jgi:phosphoglycolate phosphatase
MMSLILFDFDGVLADTLGDLLQFGQEACNELGIIHTATQEDINALEVMSFATYGKQMGVPHFLADEFVRRCLTKFSAKKSPPKIFKDMDRVLQKLSTKHSIGIITGNSAAVVKSFLAAHEVAEFVRVIYGVNEPGTKVEKILRAQNQLAAESKSVWMIGDSGSDIRAAKEASVQSIAVSWGHQSAEVLTRAEPDYLVHSPEELLKVIDRRLEWK